MIIQLSIVKITVLRTGGTDWVCFTTDKPLGIWPFEGFAVVKMEVVGGTGEQYVREHFPEATLEVLDAR